MIEEICAIYIHEKNIKNPLNNESLPKSKRIESMYNIIQNNIYGKFFDNDDKLFASSLITQILKEND